VHQPRSNDWVAEYRADCNHTTASAASKHLGEIKGEAIVPQSGSALFGGTVTLRATGMAECRISEEHVSRSPLAARVLGERVGPGSIDSPRPRNCYRPNAGAGDLEPELQIVGAARNPGPISDRSVGVGCEKAATEDNPARLWDVVRKDAMEIEWAVSDLGDEVTRIHCDNIHFWDEYLDLRACMSRPCERSDRTGIEKIIRVEDHH
jgi:hypothetical protein